MIPIVRAAFLAAIAVFMPLVAVSAEGWSHYDNGRFSYAIDIPPGFGPLGISANGDGGIARAAAGKAEFSVWGTFLFDGNFREEVTRRIATGKAEGWTMSYVKRSERAASWSGIRNGRVIYVRAMRGCGDTAAYFQLQYDRSALARYDSIVSRLVRSFRIDC